MLKGYARGDWGGGAEVHKHKQTKTTKTVTAKQPQKRREHMKSWSRKKLQIPK